MTEPTPKRLRLAFATQEYVTEGSFDGGIASYTHRTARSLKAMGHEVHVITLSTIDRAQFVHEGVIVHRVPFGRAWLELNRLTRYRLTKTMHLLGASAEIYRKLRELNSKEPFDLVQFPNCSFCGLFSLMLLRVPKVLRASWYEPLWNDSDKLSRNLDSRLVASLERLQLQLSPHVYAPSRTLKRILAEYGGLDAVQLIPSSFFLECDDWDYSVFNEFIKGKEYLLFFGRFELRKGFDALAQAMPQFLRDHPNAYVVLVGRDRKSAIAPSMAQHARSLCGSMAARLIVINQIPHRQLYPIIHGAHLVVLPSLIDNMPNACLEAMALGKAVIGTYEGSFHELIDDGHNGFLIAADDIAALSSKLGEAWASPNLPTIGEAARRRVDDFRPEKAIASLLHYYRQIMQTSPAA